MLYLRASIKACDSDCLFQKFKVIPVESGISK